MVWFGSGALDANAGLTGGMMDLMMAVLHEEKARLEKGLQSAEKGDGPEKADYEKRLHIVNSDMDRIRMYIDRPAMQTWSELLFVDDIRERVRKIQAEREDR